MSHPFRTTLSLVAVLILLTACGNSTDTEPTPTPGPPTAAAGQMTVADLIALSDSAWPTVQNMRTRSSTTSATADANAAFTGSMQDWTANGDRHIIEFQDGEAINEQIYVDGMVYMRGQFVSSAVAPELDVNTWITLDTSVVPQDTPVGVQLRYLMREQHGPYGDLTEDIMQRPVEEGGNVTIGDRSCRLYTFGDENNTGTEIRYEIAVDENGLPCQVVQRGGDLVNSTVYEFDVDVTIEAPLDGTPVSGTPEG